MVLVSGEPALEADAASGDAAAAMARASSESIGVEFPRLVARGSASR